MITDQNIEIIVSAKPIEKAKAAEADLEIEDPANAEDILKKSKTESTSQ